MSCNVTSSVLMPSLLPAPVGVWHEPSSAPTVPAVLVTSQPPGRRRKVPKYLVLPDQPDRAGMRERRKQSEMTVRELQRQRGGALPERSEPTVTGADGYRQLFNLIGSLPTKGMQILHGLMNMLATDVGPQGCAAALVNTPVPTLHEFRHQFSRDFEIWTNSIADQLNDMKGMIVLVGEDHYDPVIQNLIVQVMQGFNRGRGDRFFTEGAQEAICRIREHKYAMAMDDCHLLEKNSFAYWRVFEYDKKYFALLKNCADYLSAHVLAAPKAPLMRDFNAYMEFEQRYVQSLPPAAVPGYHALVRTFEDWMKSQDELTKQTLAERDANMAAGVRAGRGLSALNYVLVGANHLRGISPYLRDLPCVFVVPKLLVKTIRSDGSQPDYRPEL